MSPRRVTAIVIAGGRSSRFGRNKLVETVDGRTLLAYAIDSVTPFATEILVVAAPGAMLSMPAGVTLVHDLVAFEGPLAGVLEGLRGARESIVFVVGGDMPSLVGAVVEAMLVELETPGVDAVVLEHEGRPRPLPLAVRREPGLLAADRLFRGGERRLRAVPEALATRIISEATWRTLDPDGRTIRDIDYPADLADI